MAERYKSIFDGPELIRKEDLCEILNLPLPVPGIDLSSQDISAAYRKRMKLFHPDFKSYFKIDIPEEDFNIVMQDLKKARDYLLDGVDIIPGKQLCNDIQSKNEEQLVNLLTDNIKNIHLIQDDLYSLSYPLIASIVFGHQLSFFHDGRLSLAYINDFSKALETIRPYMEWMDADWIGEFLLEPKTQQPKLEKYNIDNNKHRQQILDALSALRSQNIKINDEFIAAVPRFWTNYIKNAPSWPLLITVYIESMLYRAKSLPDFINAAFVIEQTIIQQKGLFQFIFLGLPLLLLSLPLYTINAILQLGYQFSRSLFDVACNTITHGFQLLISLLLPLFKQIPQDVKMLDFWGYKLLEHSLNVSLKFLVNITLNPMHSIFFILTSSKIIGDYCDALNGNIDDFIEKFNPVSIKGYNDQNGIMRESTPDIMSSDEDTSSDEESDHPVSQQPPNAHGLFNQVNNKNHYVNPDDRWLNHLLTQINTTTETQPKPFQ